jgi:polysaccharide pyruvyl transferase WcaK-like protein
MSMALNRPVILYMHAGSGNHGCEAIADSTVKLVAELRRKAGADVKLPLVIGSNSVAEDRRYRLGELESQGLCTLAEERHIDRDFVNHVLYYGWRKITGDKESFLRYRFKDVFKAYEAKCKEAGCAPYEASGNGVKPLAVSIGGDNYCYPEMVPDLILAHSLFRRKGFETVLWGCSIEPSSLKDEALLQDLKSYSKIYARESITYNSLIEAGTDKEKLVLRKDPAFELECDSDAVPAEFVKGDYVGINLSPMVLDRAGDPQAVRESYRNFIRYILDNTDKKILLVPHVVWANNDDRKPLGEFYEEFKDTGRVILAKDASAEELKGLISRCRFFIGARTHSTIAAYSTCVPTLVLGYSVKSRGIATDLFGTDENYVIPVQKLSTDRDLAKAFDFIAKNEDSIRERLKEIMPEYSKRAADNARYIKELI